MNLGEIVMVVLILTIVSIIPFVVIGFLSRRRPTINSSLQECPHCGAQNHKAKEHCYCCGFGFIPPPSGGGEATVIQRVKQADDGKTRRRVGTRAFEDTRALDKEASQNTGI